MSLHISIPTHKQEEKISTLKETDHLPTKPSTKPTLPTKQSLPTKPKQSLPTKPSLPTEPKGLRPCVDDCTKKCKYVCSWCRATLYVLTLPLDERFTCPNCSHTLHYGRKYDEYTIPDLMDDSDFEYDNEFLSKENLQKFDAVKVSSPDGGVRRGWLLEDPAPSTRRGRSTQNKYVVIFDVRGTERMVYPRVGFPCTVRCGPGPNLREAQRYFDTCTVKKTMSSLTKAQKSRCLNISGATHPPEDILIEKYHMCITYGDVRRLRTGKGEQSFLNDNLINFYLQVCKLHSHFQMLLTHFQMLIPQILTENVRTKSNEVAVLDSHFYTKLTNPTGRKKRKRGKRGIFTCQFDDVKRWTRRFKLPLWKYRLVLFPINVAQCHWSMVVFDGGSSGSSWLWKYYNSLEGPGSASMHSLVKYMRVCQEPSYPYTQSIPNSYPYTHSWSTKTKPNILVSGHDVILSIKKS